MNVMAEALDNIRRRRKKTKDLFASGTVLIH